MKLVLVTCGICSLMLGIAGIFLPLLPTTPFVLLSAYCFARSSPRLHSWLLSNKRFGPLIRQWQEHKTIPKRAKTTAIILIAVTFSTTILFFIEQIYIQFLLVFLAVILLTYILRIPTQVIALQDKADDRHEDQ